jgi:hypothetical protein
VTQMLYNPFLRAYKEDPRFIAFAKSRRDAESRRQPMSVVACEPSTDQVSLGLISPLNRRSS